MRSVVGDWPPLPWRRHLDASNTANRFVIVQKAAVCQCHCVYMSSIVSFLLVRLF
jgi:hypothetical protein